MKKTIILSLFLSIFSFQGIACKCAYLGDFNAKEIEKYDYVALVRLMDFYPNEKLDSVKTREELYYWASIEEKSRFKGESVSKIKIYGGKREFGYGSSCDFGMKVGEEWILFGNSDGNGLLVSPCQRTTLFRNVDGSLVKDYSKVMKKLKKLKPLE
ncbi:MAG: hypothetical protein LPK25_15320 [Cyclobacteriaceae bacterium]|nr:hypothetical protein [Cyclobacteriaceae bacterium]MDX5467789.1 hypothetical protein [Cyclobacteriaceae bacterium]